MSGKGRMKEKLAAHLRRCGVIYIAGAIALVFLNNLIYTMTRPRIPEENTVCVMTVNQSVDLSQRKEEWLEEVQAADESVRALEFEMLWYDGNQVEMSMAMPVKLMAGGYDLLIADEIGFAAMEMFGAFLPLDDYLGETEAAEKISVTNAETEETIIGALKTDFLGMKDVYVGMALNSENPESTWTAFRVLREMKGEAE